MQLNPAEISELIKSRIEALASRPTSATRARGVGDGRHRAIHGLSDAMQAKCSSSQPRPTASRPTAWR